MACPATAYIFVAYGANPAEPKTMRIPADAEALAAAHQWYVLLRESDLVKKPLDMSRVQSNPRRLKDHGEQ